ncbi:penicillin-binding protein 1A [Oceanobacter mangrovi]|uniref:penicillin-binding protein 1A n=1 Tax=Oceanobacter mangrovi TaxID=2862510 RepID=UPI001FEACFCD|nr:penicillin-binding protein 1A [Oceanobacter mangrovi]
MLITEYGEKRRSPLQYPDVPPRFIDALLASEDDAFYEHYGVDVKGLLRATLELIRTGKKKSGGSTITMQVAKNYYLSSEKSFSRKFTEILLALKIEKTLSKEEILELYINKIYLGKRAYGIEAAAQVYYGKSINELTLAQTAMIAGLPQAPSAANPINNPERAISRRNYVLQRLLTLGKINQQEFEDATAAPVTAEYHGATSEVTAPYIAELVRQHMVDLYGNNAYTEGMVVYTSINSVRQQAANDALQRGLLNYDRAHGYRWQANVYPAIKSGATGTSQNRNPQALPDWLSDKTENDTDWPATLTNWRNKLRTIEAPGNLIAAAVVQLDKDGAWLITDKDDQRLLFDGMEWASPYINVNATGAKPAKPADVLAVGQQVWIEIRDQQVLLGEPPEANGALISLNPNNGAIQAMVGGFEQSANQFNRVTQAMRQPGSSFKPFIYSAALENGFTPASIINDAPVVFKDAGLENTWRPENYSGKFYGPTRLREALYKSQNLVSIRILKQMGPSTAVNYIKQFGFPEKQLNADLSLALGASAVTPMELATGYAALANGGFAIQPYYIDRIEDSTGNILFQSNPAIACRDCNSTQGLTPASTNDNEAPAAPAYAPRIMDARTNFLMVNMLKDVIQRGTGRRAKALNRSDLAGKTGTTNDQVDAWFSGFNPNLVTTVWVGFDQPSTLGRWAQGGTTALPIWVDYMRVALTTEPEVQLQQPDGIVSVRIDPKTGLLAAPGQQDAIFEYFRSENTPTETVLPQYSPDGEDSDSGLSATPELLF